MASRTPEFISAEKVYQGHVIQVGRERVRMAHGERRTLDMDVVRHPGAAAVVAIDARQRVLLVRQWRQPLRATCLELPAGCTDPGEEAEATARRELQEETGAGARQWQLLARIRPSPGWSDEVVAIFLARELTFTATHLDPDEHIEQVPTPWAEAQRMAAEGALTDAKTVCGLLLAQRWLDQHPGPARS